MCTQAKSILESATNKTMTFQEQIEAAEKLASLMLEMANKEKTALEKAREKKLSKMIQDRASKALFAAATDSSFRTDNAHRVIDHLLFLLNSHKKYALFSPLQQKIGSFFARLFPKIATAILKAFLQFQMRFVIAPGEKKPLNKRIRKWKASGVHVNLNRLGEAILGDTEANNRFSLVLQDLANPTITTISVKVSSICSQLNLLDWEKTVNRLKERLRLLYRTKKQITLDMEEYKDLFLTVQVFCEVLDEPEFLCTQAGIALQSYIPDSYTIQKQLTEWAIKRQKLGGTPIKIRIVKGANLGMERVEASIKGWPQAPYKTKAKVDANFKKMVRYGMENCQAVHLGIASHNLFDIAYSMIIACQNKASSSICFEMLAGMAPSIGRIVLRLWDNVLLYCPAARKEEFHTAIAYLSRRLDENTAPDNFLSHLFDLKPESESWNKQKELFAVACKDSLTVSTESRRNQNRFDSINSPDTDWSQAKNRLWANAIISESKNAFHEIPLVIDGKEYTSPIAAKGIDPSEPGSHIHSYSLADRQEIDTALTCAAKQKPLSDTSAILRKTAALIEANRHVLIGAMVQESAKIIPEADSEVSETIDFLSYYAKRLEEEVIKPATKVAVVLTPWNFPCSIPCSAIASSLAAGYSVIFKPAAEAVLSGWKLASFFWQAGVPKELLQFAPCQEEPTGWQLIEDTRTDIVILTGATATAKKFLQRRPSLKLFAETGGKNSLIVSSLSDHDQAVKDAIHSAFGYSGQKCSACSLLILEEEIYHSKSFRNQLLDAASTLRVGSAWDFGTTVSPLIRPASPHLLRALTTLENGEKWLLQPHQDQNNSHLWSPGIKLGSQRKGFTHQTEFFGPLLTVMCAKDLNEAIDIANETPYGLTTGLHSLDKREHALWKSRIQAGNCYINRSITGAIVGRQPFGGCKQSSFGTGMKVGGPNYLLQLADKTIYQADHEEKLESHVEEYLQSLPFTEEDRNYVKKGLMSYTYWWNSYFSKEHEMRRLIGQDNLLTFMPKSPLYVLIQENDDPRDVALLKGASLICNPQAVFAKERELSGDSMYVRALQKPPEAIEKSSSITCLDISKPSLNGRIELLSWLREVSLSYDYHRYGSLMDRQQEVREEPL